MRMTSAADPGSATLTGPRQPVEAPVDVMRTIACTSVPPSGRNSFWNTSAVKSAIDRRPFLWRGHHRAASCPVILAQPSRARATVMLSRPPCSLAKSTSAWATAPGSAPTPTCSTMLWTSTRMSSAGRAVVPQPVGADEQPARRRLLGAQRRQVGREVVGRVGAEPAGDRVGVRAGLGGLACHAGAHLLVGVRVVLAELARRARRRVGQPVDPAVADVPGDDDAVLDDRRGDGARGRVRHLVVDGVAHGVVGRGHGGREGLGRRRPPRPPGCRPPWGRAGRAPRARPARRRARRCASRSPWRPRRRRRAPRG